MPHVPFPLDVPESVLRRRRSQKWQAYPEDVLPLFVNTAMVADEVSRMKTVQALGVRLQPADVAATVWKLANLPQSALPLHACVGWQTRLFAWLGKVSPTFMNHMVTAKLAGY